MSTILIYKTITTSLSIKNGIKNKFQIKDIILNNKDFITLKY